MANILKREYEAPVVETLELAALDRISTDDGEDIPQLYSTSNGWGGWV